MKSKPSKKLKLTTLSESLSPECQHLTRFLNENSNSVTRERIFFNRIAFDMKLAAARANYDMTIHAPEVDRYGFDAALWDGEYERKLQLKTVLKNVTTESWIVTKRFFRPNMWPIYNWGFEFSPEGIGLEGGLVVIDVDNTSRDLPVSYRYTDTFVISALAHRLIIAHSEETIKPRKKSRTPPKKTYNTTKFGKATTCLHALQNGSGGDVITVPEGLLLPVKSPDQLLALLGFPGSARGAMWRENFRDALRDGFGADELGQPLGLQAEANTGKARAAADQLLELVSDGFVSFQSLLPPDWRTKMN